MRYMISEDGRLRPVHYVHTGGKIISNPPDSLVDKLGAGYPLVVDPQPAYDLDTQTLRPVYTLVGGQIVKGWKVESLETDADPASDLEPRVAALEKENAELKAALEAAVE